MITQTLIKRVRRPARMLLAAAALLLAAALVAPSATAQTGFRVEPYLQNPSSEGMTVTWFSSSPEPGRLTIHGPGVKGRALYLSSPTYEPALEYTEAELGEEIPGLEQGSWLHEGDNYKHSVAVSDLRPGKSYRYRVRQGGQTFFDRFRTPPTSERWRHIRFVALSDSETEPRGRVLRREWAPGALAEGSEPRPSAEEGSRWDQALGTTVLNQVRTLRYMLTEDEGYFHNLRVVERRDPEFVAMPGDLVQGGGYQPGWDEFFRHNAGALGNLLSRRPIMPALGNWENFGALNGGYGTPEDRSPVVRSRDKYHTYFDSPDNGTPAHRDNYYRIDYGPITFIALDSSNGEPDDSPDNYPPEGKATGREFNGPGTDTQSNFTRAEYEAAGGIDLADFNPASTQWDWAERELAAARREGQVIFVQFHHAPFSNGEHGLPMDHELTSGQGGTPMRRYHEMFERNGVIAVLSGHSEMFERSFVDADGDGVGVTYYDVGVAGDGLRGERRDGTSLNDPLLKYNPQSRWTGDQSEPERWKLVNGIPQLVETGKHYGHLEVNVKRLREGRGGGGARSRPAVEVAFTPVHVFPILDDDYSLVRAERRRYGDVVVLYLNGSGEVCRPLEDQREAPDRDRAVPVPCR
ncbi:MAG: metallophosphoesterase [Actinomycetota bacterium]